MAYSPEVNQGRNGIAAALMNIAQPPPQLPPQAPSQVAPTLPMQQPLAPQPPPQMPQGAPPPIPQQGMPMPPPFAPPGMPSQGTPLPNAPPATLPIAPRQPLAPAAPGQGQGY